MSHRQVWNSRNTKKLNCADFLEPLTVKQDLTKKMFNCSLKMLHFNQFFSRIMTFFDSLFLCDDSPVPSSFFLIFFLILAQFSFIFHILLCFLWVGFMIFFIKKFPFIFSFFFHLNLRYFQIVQVCVVSIFFCFCFILQILIYKSL